MILKQEALEGVLPPTLFFIFLSNITEYMPKKVSHVLHADDLAFLDLWCIHHHRIYNRMQQDFTSPVAGQG